jgi:multidrug resistance protein
MSKHSSDGEDAIRDQPSKIATTDPSEKLAVKPAALPEWTEDDKGHPRNWAVRQKWTLTLITGSITFMSPLSSSMVAPALETISAEFGIVNDSVKTLTLSIFVLGYAIGPLVLGPIAELYGRARVLQMSNLFYLAFNLACGFSQNTTQLIVLRFFAGLGGSAPLAVGGAILSDLWAPEVRGKALAGYSCAILLGPVLGPLISGFVVQHTTWRWIFRATSIADGVVQLLAFIFLRETCPSVLLARRRRRFRKECIAEGTQCEEEPRGLTLSQRLARTLTRAVRMILFQPIVQVLALYMAFQYGVYYLMLSTFAELWTSPQHYNYPVDISGLHYISIGVGYLVGILIFAQTSDRIYQHLKETRGGGKGCPEYRLPLLLPASILLPIGLFIYGWAGEHTVFWFVTDLGAAIFGLGGIVLYQGIQAYIIECYDEYAASSLAATAFVRSIAACTFPLFANQMYDALGWGWGNSLLAFLFLFIGVPAIVGLWQYGPGLRAKRPFSG